MGNSRIRWLVAAHLIFAAAPLLIIGLSSGAIVLPLEWALGSFPLGSLMTLSVWAGMGRTRLLWRCAFGLAAIFYLTIFTTIVDATRLQGQLTIAEWIMQYLNSTAELAIMFVLLGVTFLLLGFRFELARLGRDSIPAQTQRLQFSVTHVLVVMSVAAVVLSLLHASRAIFGRERSTWESITIYAFLFVTFFVNTACAVFAALGLGRVRMNVALVFVVAALLGVATAFAMHNDMTDGWLFFGSTLIVIVPTVIVLLSMLVVRSCGYRVIQRVRALRPEAA